MLFLDDVRLPADALVGVGGRRDRAAVRRAEPGADHGRGRARSAWAATRIDKAVEYAKTRAGVEDADRRAPGPRRIRSRRTKIELELAKLMMQKAATLYDSGDDMGAGEAANMAKYAAAEASHRARSTRPCRRTAATVSTQRVRHRGRLITASRLARIAPVSREMILNFVAQFSLGLPKSLLMAPSHYAVDRATVATITLDSPHNRNALSSTLVERAAPSGCGDAAADPSVRAVVLTHTGGTFCAGADLSEQASRGRLAADGTRADDSSCCAAIVELPKPVIARDRRARARRRHRARRRLRHRRRGPRQHLRVHRGAPRASRRRSSR